MGPLAVLRENTLEGQWGRMRPGQEVGQNSEQRHRHTMVREFKQIILVKCGIHVRAEVGMVVAFECQAWELLKGSE